ncbi:MAG: hypothetical protein ACREKE_06195 [bacterium]
MIKPKVVKGFDCVKMKHDAQAKIYRATKGMTSDQRLQYIHDQVNDGPLGHVWRRLGRKTVKAA